MVAGSPHRQFRILVLARNDEVAAVRARKKAPTRPLLIVEDRSGRSVQVARNDVVVLKADEGGQCDPFDPEGGGAIAVKGRYFTVENGVACGQHWTDYITFRFDDRRGFVFDNQRSESWRLNSDARPQAEALVRDGPAHVSRARPGSFVPFQDWRPSR